MTIEAHKIEFVKEITPIAWEICPKYGVPPEVCVAQAVLESGWGKHAVHNNMFGLKGSGNNGKSILVTTEWTGKTEGGGYKPTTATFARFKTKRSAIEAYCKRVTSGFFRGSPFFADDPSLWILWIWASGYATAPNYPERVLGVMQSIVRHVGDERFKVTSSNKAAELYLKLRGVTAGKARRNLRNKLMGAPPPLVSVKQGGALALGLLGLGAYKAYKARK